MTRKGVLITLPEVLYSWALAEAYSPRWKEKMRKGLSEATICKLDAGQITALDDDEKRQLVERLKQHRKHKIKGYVAPYFLFLIGEIYLNELEQLAVAPQISGWEKRVPLGEFINGEYSKDTYHDPRNSAQRMLASPLPIPYAGYPIVSFSKKLNCPVLLEGYTRCIAAIMRQRAGETVPPIKVIFCGE